MGIIVFFKFIHKEFKDFYFLIAGLFAYWVGISSIGSELTGWIALLVMILILYKKLLKPKKPVVFISYKSNDASLARFIAEALKGSGIYAWFAEYNILFNDWFDENKFTSSISSAVSNSRFAIIISNDGYIDSPYCILELEGILKNINNKKILHIKLTSSEALVNKYPRLAKVRTYVFNCDKIGLLAEIERLLMKNINTNTLQDIEKQRDAVRLESVYNYAGHNVRYSIDTSLVHVLHKDGSSWFHGNPDIPDQIGGPMIVIGDINIDLKSVIGGFSANINPFPEYPKSGIFDESFVAYLKANVKTPIVLEYADKLVGKQCNQNLSAYMYHILLASDYLYHKKGKISGVHLYHLNNVAGITYSGYTYSHKDGNWCRVYFIHLPLKGFDFAIIAEFMSINKNGKFEDFLNLVPIMDNVINSIIVNNAL